MLAEIAGAKRPRDEFREGRAAFALDRLTRFEVIGLVVSSSASNRRPATVSHRKHAVAGGCPYRSS